jgi:hypothetical protein
MVVVVCSVLLQKWWLAKYLVTWVTWNTWGDRQMGIRQYLVMGISWSRDPQVFQQMEEVQGFTRSHWMPPSGKYCSQ